MKSNLLPVIIGASIIAIATLLYAIILPSAPQDELPLAEVQKDIIAPQADNQQTIVTPSSDEDASDEGYKLVIDIARVQADGMAVFAGRGAPEGTIFITENGQIFAQNTINEQGEWVVLPEQALSPGAHLLQLTMVTKDGETQRADVSLVVEIAENNDEKPLVALVPQTDDETPTLLQSPDDDTPQDSVKSASDEQGFTTQAEQVAEILGQEDIFVQIGSLSWRDATRLHVHGVASGGDAITGSMADERVNEVSLTSTGRWSTFVTGNPFATGDRQTLTIQLIDADDKILEQTRLNVSQSQLSAGLDGSLMVVVHKGDALWRIAYRSYGEGVRYVDIFRRNSDKIDDPDLIYPNQIFAVPGVKTTQ